MSQSSAATPLPLPKEENPASVATTGPLDTELPKNARYPSVGTAHSLGMEVEIALSGHDSSIDHGVWGSIGR